MRFREHAPADNYSNQFRGSEMPFPAFFRQEIFTKINSKKNAIVSCLIYLLIVIGRLRAVKQLRQQGDYRRAKTLLNII